MTDTANKFLNKPSTGAEIGTWGVSLNENLAILDSALGGRTTLAVTNVDVVLSSAQYQNVFLSVSGQLSGNVAVTLPSVGSFYSVQNLTTNSSLYNITLKTTAAGSQLVGVPPGGDYVDVMTDGSNVKFRNLGRVGSYVDIASSATPLWITACTVPPYLYCNGGTFSSATYPVLRTMLGNTTLPDCRGRTRFMLDGGTNRNTTFMSGNTLKSGGGNSQIDLGSANNIPWIAGGQFDPAAVAGASPYNAIQVRAGDQIINMPTAIISGITLIRAG